MKIFLFVFLISCFSLTIISCGGSSSSSSGGSSSTTDTTSPVPAIAEITAVTTPTNDNTPNYTFSSTEAGIITYGSYCTSERTFATSGYNTITFLTLSDGTYSDCTIIVTDSDGNASNTPAVTTFVVDTTTTDSNTDSSSSSSATAIAAGNSHTCALLDNASVKCWGRNSYGQLGIDNTRNMGDESGEMGDNLNAINL